MSSVKDHLSKLREDRLAREKARIEKLRELNRKKYNKDEPQQQKHTVSSIPVPNKGVRSDGIINRNITNASNTKNNVTNSVKNNFHVNSNFHANNATKRPTSVPTLNKKVLPAKDTNVVPNLKPKALVPNKDNTIPIPKSSKDDIKPMRSIKPDVIPKIADKKPTTSNGDKNVKKQIPISNNFSKMSRKSFVPVTKSSLQVKTATNMSSRKSLAAPSVQATKSNDRESVFDRLYKPKIVAKKTTSDVSKLHTDSNYLKKVVRDSRLILNKRHTVFDFKQKVVAPVRRSISAVHFKRISKNEISNCVHKWSSIGDKLDKVHLDEINEDESVKQDKVISAVKSERKRVKFQTPVPFNFNTPKPEELQSRLKNWLQKRGKSLDSYHHLQCFGIHHINQKEVRPIIEPHKFEFYDDEDKENIALEHDSDNDSFTDNMNDDCEQLEVRNDRWRRASYVSDSVDLNDTQNSTLTDNANDTIEHVDEVLLGALNDLTELLREGFDWEQCACWLRAIRERFPYAPETAAYWECRAALEETRGDLPASVQCWEEAIAKGTERSIVESNLDQLLDKFMQLKISPNSGKRKVADSKMVDVKNVFKSTIIRFAVQQAKLRRSNQHDLPKYTVTPVRRSSRISGHWSAKKPLQECMSVKHAKQLAPVMFIPNPSLCRTP